MGRTLELDNVHAFYGKSHILQGVSLEIHLGETVCLLGRNGAGKTTLIRSIMGLNPPKVEEGSICFNGKNITNKFPFLNAREGIGYVPQGRRIFPKLTTLDNLKIIREDSGMSIEELFTLFPLLKRVRNSKGEELSGGERQVLAIARGLVNNPKMFLLDEPSEGLAPLVIQSIRELIKTLRGNMAILLAEQNVKFGLQASDRGYVIDKGRIVYVNSSDEIWGNEQVKRNFLGV